MKRRNLYFLIFSVVAYAVVNSPFEGRNYGICQDFRVSHVGKVLEVISTENMTHNWYIVEVNELYFSWGNLALRVGKNNRDWKNLHVGDKVPLEMLHTTSDVVCSNRYIEEGFSHALMSVDELNYFGFSLHPVDTIQSISLETGTETGELGSYPVYSIHVMFSHGEKIQLQVFRAIDPKTLAQPGDRVLIANGFLMREHVYSPNPYGNKKVFQNHHTGPLSSEPVYKKPTYGQVLFNLSRGTTVNL